MCEVERRERIAIEVEAITAHHQRIEFASGLLVGGGEHLPHLIVHGTLRVGTLPTDECRFRIAVCKEILCGKDIRLFAFGCCLSIGSKLCQKIVVVFFFFRACEKIVKEITGACIVAPEYREIVLPVISLPSFKAPLSRTLPRCLRSPARSPVHADRRSGAVPHCLRHSRPLAHVRADKCVLSPLQSPPSHPPA